MKRIIVVCLKYSYGIKKNGLSLNHTTLIDGLKKLNYKLSLVWIDEYKSISLEDEINKRIEIFNPDLIFFKLYKNEISLKYLKLIKTKVRTVNWFGDDSWRFDSFSYRYVKCFNAIITTDQFAYTKYKKLGVKNIYLSQHAGVAQISKKKISRYKYEVSFIGTKTPFRYWVIKKLLKSNINVKCFGKGWNSGIISSEQIIDIYKSSKINLNIKNGFSYDIRFMLFYPKSLIQYLYYKLNNKDFKTYDGIKARDFEITINGGLVLTYYTPFLEKYFNIGKEIICYNSIDEIPLLVNFYLENEDNREKIRNKGLKRSNSDHNFYNRIEDILLDIKEIDI